MHRRLGLIALIAAVLLAACGGKDAAGVPLQTPPTSRAPAAAPTPEPGFGALRDAPGVLLYTEGSALYAYPHGASAPVALADNADPQSLVLAPEHDGLLYASEDSATGPFSDGTRTVYHVNLATLAQTPILEDTGGFEVLSWSPDRQWVLLRANYADLQAIRLDGTQRYNLSSLRAAEARWLTDGAILLTTQQAQNSDSDVRFAYTEVNRFDVQTGQSQPLAVDLAALSRDPSQMDQALAALGLGLAPAARTTAPRPQLMRSEEGAGVCDTWHIAYLNDGGDGVDQIVYSAANVYRMSTPERLPDGALLFLETRIPDCQIINPPQVTLMYLPPGGEVITLADEVSEGPRDSSPFMITFAPAVSFAASPDGRYVVWIGGGVTAGWSSLELLDLETNAHARLAYTDRSATGAPAFTEDDLFNAVLWAGAEPASVRVVK